MSRQVLLRQVCAASLLATTMMTATWTGEARAAEPAAIEERLSSAAREIDAGGYQAAINELERLADSGVSHPDVSFTRGVAYLRRAGTDKAQPGDLGQAAAAFRETLLLRPDDALAARGLEEARLTAAKKAASGGETVIEAVGLGQRLLLSLDAWVLLLLACFGSVLSTLGLVFFRFGKDTKRTGGAIALSVGSAILLTCLPLSLFVTFAQESIHLGIVIATRAPLLDAQGRAIKGVAPLPEGTEVHVVGGQANLVQLSTGVGPGGETWMRRSQLRMLASPSSRN